MAKHKHKQPNNLSQSSTKSKKKPPSIFKQFKTELITATIIFIIAGVVTWKIVQSSNHPIQSSKPSITKRTGLPKMIDLGTTTCTPCKMMIPVMEELTKEYNDKLIVEFINTAENPEKSSEYGISVIPTQIFYDKNGVELTRHTGYIPKEDVIKTFKDYGINLN